MLKFFELTKHEEEAFLNRNKKVPKSIPLIMIEDSDKSDDIEEDLDRAN